MVWLISSTVFISLVLYSNGQDMCENDAGCPGEDNCCSDFGFCGKGEGFCTPSTRRDSGTATATRTRPATRTRSGAGCVLDDVEWVGGDLPAIVGGGGIKIDRNTANECFSRCDENPGCKWYTYDTKKELCYLKSGRGYMRNRTDGFISGATFRDGCNEDPYCDTPYSYNRQQCLFFSEQHHPWSPSLADARRNLNNSRELCKEFGGFIPNDFSGYSGGSSLGDRWHWVGYGADDSQCWACRPGRWGEGVRAFPCTDSHSFACERRRAYSLPLPRSRPRVYQPAASMGCTGGCGRRPRNRVRPRLRTLQREAILARRYQGAIRSNPFLYV
eukprot:TRINITY_DN2312_c0_g1_i2.p1 TRINITY_DN2312_c0_g1~~TRINITY_DN2312_c0_g1_i2.p1  ORF type:complete len:330 (-),score=69.34 TRINITY_DN2312_c0_g1_i2:58-1047(-)